MFIEISGGEKAVISRLHSRVSWLQMGHLFRFDSDRIYPVPMVTY